jgi:DNA invertase Pin-like site-specific DNA recombinase
MITKPRGVRLVRLSKTPDPTSTSVPRQIEITDGLADELDTDIVGEGIDLSVSAFKIHPFKRKGVKQWLERTDEFDRFLCWRLDRVFRDPFHFMDMAKWCRENGKGIYSAATGNVDLTTDQGMVIGFLSSWQANQESKATSARVINAQDYLARIERYRGGRKPYGYHSICICHEKTHCPTLMPDKPKGWKLVPDEADRAPKAREAAERIISGESVHAVAVDFNRRGITTSDGKMWLAGTLRKVMLNPAMIGLIGPEKYGQLKLAIKERTVNRQVRTLDRSSLLLDIVFCGECGGKIYRWYRKERDRYYGRCRNEMKRGQVSVQCRAPMVPYEVLTEAVTHDLMQHKDWIIETRVTDMTRRLRAEQIELNLDSLNAERAARTIGRAEFEQRQRPLLDELDALESADSSPEWVDTSETVGQRWERLNDAERRLWLLRIGTTWTVERVTRGDGKAWRVASTWRAADDPTYRERVIRPN